MVRKRQAHDKPAPLLTTKPFEKKGIDQDLGYTSYKIFGLALAVWAEQGVRRLRSLYTVEAVGDKMWEDDYLKRKAREREVSIAHALAPFLLCLESASEISGQKGLCLANLV